MNRTLKQILIYPKEIPFEEGGLLTWCCPEPLRLDQTPMTSKCIYCRRETELLDDMIEIK